MQVTRRQMGGQLVKPPPEIIAAEIMEDRRAALAQFAEIAADLGSREALE